MNVLVTGESGFLGGHLCIALKSEQNAQLTACSRKGRIANLGTLFKITSSDSKTNWSRALEGKDVVVHVAARANIMRDEVDSPVEEYQKVNVDGTLNLARQASLVGVARFVFVSSIKVNGERTLLDRPFKPDDRPAPEDAYGISKYQAEAGLIKLTKKIRNGGCNHKASIGLCSRS
jgi:nucleoside-diphosphate-sugar epimerase